MSVASDVRSIADAIAVSAHSAQRRRHGAPYIDHPRAVCAIADDIATAVGLPFGEDDAAVALMHDVLEDSPHHTLADVSAACGVDVANRVQLLTKVGKGHDVTVAYYQALMGASSSTRLIKIADRLHNLSELHKAHSDTKLREYVDETLAFVRPLADGFDAAPQAGLRAAVDHAIDNALRNGAAVVAGAAPTTTNQRGLYAIVHPRGGAATTLARLSAMLRGGATRVQLRVKPADGLTDQAWLALLIDVATLAGRHGADVVVNDRADLAFAARLLGHPVGVHVGDGDLPPRFARALLGADALLGTSTHSVAQLRAMVAEGSAGHVALGPIWASPTKQGHADVVGPEALREACSDASLPVVAIGGITTTERAAIAARAGAAWIAVVSALDGDSDDAVHLVARRFALSIAAAHGASAVDAVGPERGLSVA